MKFFCRSPRGMSMKGKVLSVLTMLFPTLALSGPVSEGPITYQVSGRDAYTTQVQKCGADVCLDGEVISKSQNVVSYDIEGVGTVHYRFDEGGTGIMWEEGEASGLELVWSQ